MRVKPILKFGLVAGALALPGAAYPLGLGKLTVDSYLGQPLSARIELLPTSKEELDSVSARIADANLYRQNNLQYQGVLARARISLERGPGDSAYLKVTSPSAVSEPYLDLLVEVNWASGRVVRDYTFLLDPPGTAIAQPVDPITPLRQGAPAATAAARPAASPAGSTQAAAPAAPRGEGDSYEVKRGDSLSKIATQFKPETVTLDQMLVALFRNNQGAFEGGNMNRLRSGAIITIPNAVDASATQAAEATRTVHVQASDWRAYRDGVAGAAPMADERAGRASGGRIGTAVDEPIPAVRPGSDQLRVSKDAGTAKSGGAETTAARDSQLRDAQSRVADLERTLKDLQRAIELKNPTMARLETQSDPAKGKAPVAPVSPPPSATAPPVGTAPAVAPAPSVAAPVAAVPKAVEPAVTPPTKVAEAPKVEPPVVEPKAAEPPKAAPTVVAKAAAKEPPGFFEDMLGSAPGWAIGAGALAVLAGLAALIASRRRKTTKFEDSIISGTDIKTNTVFGSTGGGVVNTGDNSLASDFSREGLGNIDTDEVDPIAEAEVYLAYGRDAQAEEILKDALKKDPQRQEIYLKLLEIHAQHNKPSAFETVASELYAVTSGQGDAWQKAVVLGRQLDPNNPMFAEGGAPGGRASVVAGAAAGAAAAGAMAYTSDPHRIEPRMPDIARDDSMEFQMDEEISISPTSGAVAKTPADILAGAESELENTARHAHPIDDDPDATHIGPYGAVAAASAALAGALAASNANSAAMNTASADASKAKGFDAPRFDLDFRLDDADKPAPLGKSRPEPEFETATAGGGNAPTLTRPAAALELDKLDLSFDPERTTFEDPTPSVLDGQWHDAATKLDLAKAYQEMGDVEGAREILQEVLHEGDDQQKVEAKSLLAKLS